MKSKVQPNKQPKKKKSRFVEISVGLYHGKNSRVRSQYLPQIPRLLLYIHASDTPVPWQLRSIISSFVKCRASFLYHLSPTPEPTWTVEWAGRNRLFENKNRAEKPTFFRLRAKFRSNFTLWGIKDESQNFPRKRSICLHWGRPSAMGHESMSSPSSMQWAAAGAGSSPPSIRGNAPI